MQYKNFGANVNIFDVAKLKTLGQVVELDPKLARDVIEGGGCILPAEDFDAIGFTADEIKKYPSPGHVSKAPESFLLKRDAALERWKELRAEYQRADAQATGEVEQESPNGE